MPKKPAFYVAVLAFCTIASAAYAQYGMPSPTPVAPVAPSAISRTVLHTADFPDQFQTIQAYVVIAPGATAAAHTHPGIELGYVLDGEGDFYVKGEPKRHLKPGDSFLNPAGVPHGAVNTSSTQPLKIVSTYVVEKGKPLATPAAPFF
ncbi:MAG TPA: cupin domain-containing protein [Candidatus Acidoferrales bacterium]|nr:cupin domain-containing protein [Candidatus Acidoferrales bacterium]